MESARIEQLLTEISILREQLLQAQSALRGEFDWIWPSRFRITPHLETILRCLYKHAPAICSHEMLHFTLYSDRLDQDWPQQRILQVQICKLRNCLPDRSFVLTSWGRGYRLAPEGKAWIDTQIRKQHSTNGKG